MKLKQIINLLILSSVFLLGLRIEAVRESRPTPIDSRIRLMVYNPNDVFKFTGYYGYQASIELAPGEQILNISMGDSTAWQILPSGHRIFIKPVQLDAMTNMTLITDKRTYFFELYAEEAQDIRDPNMVFLLRFIYPDDEEHDNDVMHFSQGDKGPDLSKPEKYNFNYSMSGSEEIAPIKVYDDGEFMYLQFRDKNAAIPACFAVSDDLTESMVNYHMSSENKNLMIIEQVFPKLSLRLGKKVTCIFNEIYK